MTPPPTTPMESWEKPPVEFCEVPEHHIVLVDGRQVPNLEAVPMPGGKMRLMIGTAVLDCDLIDAEHVVRFVADAIARTMGYVAHPRADQEEAVPLPPFTRIISVAASPHGLDQGETR